MRRRLGVLAVVGLGLLGTGCGRLMAWVGRPRVTDVRPRIVGIDLESVRLAFDLDVRNPYPVRLKAPVLRYGLAVEGSDLLSGERMVHLDVPPRSTGTVTLPTALSYAKLWRTYRQFREAKKVSYRLHGTLLVSVLGYTRQLPLSRRGTVPVMHAPRLEGLRLAYSPVSWRGAQVTLHADVHNPNAFPIGIHDLRYQLQLGKVDVVGLAATTGGAIGPDQRGDLTLTGSISTTAALLRIARGDRPGKPSLSLSGSIQTPYGTVDLNRRPVAWKRPKPRGP